MYELNGEEVTLEFLQGKAQEYNMDFDSYLEIMKTKGLVEKTSDVATQDAPVTSASDMASNSEDTSLGLPEIEEFDPSKTDLTAGSSVRYMAGTKDLPDFNRNILPSLSEIYREQDLKETPITLDNPKNTFKVDEKFDRRSIEELEQQIIPDFEITRISGGTMGAYTSPIKLTSEQIESNRLVKAEIQRQKQFGKNQVRDISLANFFSQSSMIKDIIKELSMQEFAAKNPNGGDLRKAFKSYFESLPEEVANGISQEDADEVFQDIFAHLQDKEKQTIKKQTEQIAVDDAISKGVPLPELTDSLNESMISTYGGDKNFKEQQLALINEKERKWGKGLISMSSKEYEDMMKTKAKIIDDLYYEDEVIEDYLPGGEVVRRKTGKRIPKEEKYKMFHDLVLGRNIKNPSSSKAPAGTQDITDLYEIFLSTYKNTSLGSLEKINDRLLIEEAGYDIEGKQKIDIKVTDTNLSEALRLLQYTGEVKIHPDQTGRFEVTLNALTAASIHGEKWWSNDAQIFSEQIDEIAPSDGFEGKPYSTGPEFLDYLNVRRRRGASIKAEKAALWKLYHLNEDITSIGDNRWGRFFQSTLSGLGVDEENIPKVIGYTDAKVQDVISQSILPDMGKFGSYDPETGIGLSEDQSRYLERDFSDKLVETAGGLTGMTPGLIGLNKVQGILGINKLIGTLMAPKYFVKGKQLSNTSISKFAISRGKSVDDLVTQGVITKRSATAWEKAQGIIIGGIAEDIKMREGMGAIGMQPFERGVGFGFFAGSRLLPYDFRSFEFFGKKRNQLNTFLNLTAKNGPAFTIAAEAGEAINATIEDLQGNQEFMTFVKKHWGDYGENLERTILHLITGTGLGAFHLKKNDIRTTNQISQFNQLAAEKMITAEASLKEKAIEEGIKVSNEEAYAKWLNEKYKNNDPLAAKAVKYQQDFMMSMEYLSRINDIDAWTDPVKGQKLWNEYFEPVRQQFLKQGKELVLKFSDKPLRQEYVDADGKMSYNESSALYTRLSAKEGGTGKAIVEVYIPAGKGRGTASHEMLHAYLDLMFDGKPKLKEAFESSLRETLQKVTLLNGESLFNAIVQDQALVRKGKDGSVDLAATKQIRFEEMMAYTAEYLAKAENQNLYDSKTLSEITKFFNNFSKSITGKNADLYTGRDLVNLLAHYGKTGKISDLKNLEQYVELGVETSDVLASVAEGKKETATKVINDYNSFAKDKAKENVELFETKPEGYKELMAQNVKAIKEAKNNIETIEKAIDQGNPKTELNKNLFEQVVDPTTKEVSFEPKFTRKQISKELAEGKGEAYDAMWETQRQAMNSALIENLIKKGVVGNQIPKGGQAEIDFIDAVKERLENKFRNEFNPEKNDNVFGWFTGTSGGQGKSIIFRAKGDVMNKYNKQIKTTSKEVIEGFDNMFADNTGGAGSVGGEAPLVRQRFTETVEYKQEALDIIENAAIRENIDVDGLTYKDVKKLIADQKLINGKVPTSAKNVEATGPLKDILEVVGEKHGIPLERILANQTLTTSMRNTAREVIFNERLEKIDALPEGTTPSGKSTGIANTKLGEFYVKGEAVKMAKTGSRQGLAEQSKQDIIQSDFLELFGIKPDGTFMPGTKYDGAIREYLKQEASIIANQAARQYAGKPEAKIGEGRSIKMASVLRDKFIEKFPELSVEQIRDKFLYKHHGVEEALTKAERDFFKTSEFDKVIQNREDAIAFALMESRVVAGKTKQFKFENTLRTEKYDNITLNNGLKIDGKKINLLDISATTRIKDGQTIVDVPKVKEMIKHSLNVAELLPASLSKNKSLFTEMLFMHRRTNLEGYSKESRTTRLAEGKKDIIAETGESVAGLDITKSKDKAVNRAGLKEDVLREIWKDVVVEFNSATSQVTGAKKIRKAKTDLEREQIAEKYFSQLSERSKESVYDAMGKTLEYYVKEAKTEAEFLSRAEYVMRGMRSNSDLRLGFRQLAAIIAVYKGKATFDANQLKLEHLKTSAAQSYKAGQLIVSGQWSSMGKQTLKDFVGVLSPKELLDIIDAKGGKTNIEALYRMAMLEPATLKDFVTIESGGKENLLDYVLRVGKERLSADALRESFDAKRLLEATNKNIENGTGIKGEQLDAQLASRTQKEIDAALTLGRVASKTSRKMRTYDFDDTLATTKSGVRYEMPNPSGKPAPQRKAILLVGAAGSGKTTVINQLGLRKQGFKYVNQDVALDWLSRNSGLPKNMNEFTVEQSMKWRNLQYDAAYAAKDKASKLRGKGDGVIIDSTGGNIRSISRDFKDAGYDVQVIYVNSSLETALTRNRSRTERRLTDTTVKNSYEKVQKNLKEVKELVDFFPKSVKEFVEVNTDNIKQGDALPADFVKKINNFTSGYIKGRINAEQFALEGSKLLEQGAKYDFSEFNKVVEGAPGPLLKSAIENAKKLGTENMFVLTARPAESARPIREFLKSQGLDIPLENITGLGNSTGEAKALWMLKKFSEGYNDMYFVDDALPNVKAVKHVLSQLDIKSDVQQAIASRDFNKKVNDILEYSLGIQSNKVFSKAEAKVRGKDIKRRRFFIPDTAADLELLLEPLYGKGKQGVENKKWFEENFIRKWERGINDFNNARQTITNDYMSLRKKNKDIVKQLPEAVEGTNFTHDQAIRVYIWNKNGYTIPDLAPTTQQKLVKYVMNNPKLKSYAENLAKLTKVEGGLKEPSAEWWGETIATEIQDLGKGIGRKKYIEDFIDSKNEIFSESNLNKMESKLGTNWRETIEDMFDRMETGRTRSMRLGKTGNALMNYLNGSTGAIMNFNTRSAVLQLISTVNFVNSSFNNPLMAAKAFANQSQYWKDFMTIMNSDMLKQRRQGLEINVSEAELAAVASQSKNPARAVLAKILKAGYLPTKVADSFAIASGGATYYRNAINKYLKEGLSKAEAERKAFVDFQAIAERTQQSSRADLLSKQQTSFEGRLILAFANTPMQMNRIMMKDLLDISKGRYEGFYGEGSLTSKMSRIGYYGFAQSLIFAGLQSGAFALMANSDDEKKIADSKLTMLNTVADSFLRGMGVQGATLNGIRLAIQEFIKQDGKKYNADYSEVAEKLLNISPTVGSKFSKLDAAGNTYNYNKKVIKEEGLTLNGPLLEASTQVIESTTNLPLNRYYKKGNNIQNALDDSYYNWQRVLSGMGWSVWGLGEGKDESRVRIKNKGKETEYTKYLTKEDLRREQVLKEVKEEQKKEKKAKQQRCTKVKSDGTRCKIMVTKPKTRCHYHD